MGDGSAIRDFVYSKDVAKSMIKVIEKNIQIPINIGSGNGTSIKKLVYTILNSKKIKNKSKLFLINQNLQEIKKNFRCEIG